MERFFRNLLLGEQWDLRSRYLHIAPTEQWKEQVQLGKLQSNVTQNITQNVTQNVPQKRTVRQQEILRLIEADKTISAATMAATLGVTVRSIRRDIEAIRKHYNLQYVGPTKGGHWEIIEN